MCPLWTGGKRKTKHTMGRIRQVSHSAHATQDSWPYAIAASNLRHEGPQPKPTPHFYKWSFTFVWLFQEPHFRSWPPRSHHICLSLMHQLPPALHQGTASLPKYIRDPFGKEVSLATASLPNSIADICKTGVSNFCGMKFWMKESHVSMELHRLSNCTGWVSSWACKCIGMSSQEQICEGTEHDQLTHVHHSCWGMHHTTVKLIRCMLYSHAASHITSSS